MKHVFISIILILIYKAGITQRSLSFELTEIENVKIITIDEGSGKEQNHYSPRGEITKSVVEQGNKVFNKTDYYYNKNRQIKTVKKYGMYSNTEELKFSGMDEYKYDENDKLIETRTLFWGVKPVSDQLREKTTFEYDSQGRLVKKTISKYKWNNSVGTKTILTFKYNTDNTISSIINHRNGKLLSIEKYYHNSNGVLISISTTYAYENDYSRAAASFKNDLEMVRFEKYYIESKPRKTEKYKYDSSGRLTSIRQGQEYTGGEPFVIHYQYKYFSEEEKLNSEYDISFVENSEAQSKSTTVDNEVGFTSFIPIYSQFQNGQKTKALILLGSIGIASYLTYHFKNIGDKTYKEYTLSTNVDETSTLYDEAEKYRKQSIAFASISGVVVLYAIIDGYLVAKKNHSNSKIAFTPYYDGKSLSASLLVKF
jgi:hypothetical protein